MERILANSRDRDSSEEKLNGRRRWERFPLATLYNGREIEFELQGRARGTSVEMAMPLRYNCTNRSRDLLTTERVFKLWPVIHFPLMERISEVETRYFRVQFRIINKIIANCLNIKIHKIKLSVIFLVLILLLGDIVSNKLTTNFIKEETYYYYYYHHASSSSSNTSSNSLLKHIIIILVSNFALCINIYKIE